MDLTTVQALYRYSDWANERTLDAVAQVAAADFTRDLGSSYPSLRDTLAHLVWAEWIWLQRWKGVSPTVVFAPAEFPTVESLRSRLHAVAAERAAYLGQLTDERLGQPLEYTNRAGEVWRYPLWQQLHHVANHSTYHRGQIATLLRQLGAVPAATDFLLYYDAQAS